MNQKDYSKEIYENYYSQGKMLQVFLKDGSMHEGIFVSFFHGDIEFGEPFVIRWGFVNESDIGKYHSIETIEFRSEFEKIIKQKEIERVQFKVG